MMETVAIRDVHALTALEPRRIIIATERFEQVSVASATDLRR
jgi:hypothetical protein